MRENVFLLISLMKQKSFVIIEIKLKSAEYPLSTDHQDMPWDSVNKNLSIPNVFECSIVQKITYILFLSGEIVYS